MKEFKDKGLRLYVADDVHGENPLAHFSESYKSFAYFAMFNTQEYINYFINHPYGDENISVLDAHGNTWKDDHQNEKKWYYFDGDEELLVQDWIDEHDGEATALVLYPCNPAVLPIRSSKSLILHQRGSASMQAYKYGKQARLYVPEVGYIDPDPSRFEVLRNECYSEFSLGFPSFVDRLRKMRKFTRNVVI